MEKQSQAIITLSSGKDIDLFDPRPSDIDFMDIALGLANKPHFSGQTKRFFSIAEHSVLTVVLEERLNKGIDKKFLLFHDANEAILPDMIKPLKINLDVWSGLENTVQRAIQIKFEIDNEPNYDRFKYIDVLAQCIEYHNFYPERDVSVFNMGRLEEQDIRRIKNGFFDNLIKYHDPRGAKILFMDKARELKIKF